MYRHLPHQPNLAYTNEAGELVICHSSGFYSCCSIKLRKIINWYNEHQKFPIVDSSKQWSTYKDIDENVSTKFFGEYYIKQPYTNHVEFSTDTVEDQFSDYSKINFDEVTFFIKRYFTPSFEVQVQAHNLIDKYNIDVNNTIAVCYRGTDKKMETNIPTHAEMFEKIREIIKENPKHKLLIQSDEQEFIDAVHVEFPDHIHFTESRKVPANHRAVQFYFPAGEKVQHAQIFLAIMQILSKCDKLILNSGNVGMWLCLFRNNTEGVTQYLNPLNSQQTSQESWIY